MKSDGPAIYLKNSNEATYDYVMEHGWGDGFPVIPPTEARVEEMLRYTDREPTTVLGVLPPGRGEATVFKVAINAVLAGCRPEYLPVVITAIEALARPEFNLYGIQGTTNPVAVAGFVNGPVVSALAFNAGWNCLGQGNRANATVGRAIRLCMVNIGGGRPGDLDRATHGQPAKYSFFFAENESMSPWVPFHVDSGFDASTSTVTVFANTGTLNMLEPSENPEEMLHAFSVTMRCPGTNDYMSRGGPFLLISPEHAEVLHAGGYSKLQIQRALWEQTKIPVRDFSQKSRKYWLEPMWTDLLGELTDDTLIPCGESPDRIKLVVAGGPSIHTVFVPTFGDSMPVTAKIAHRDGSPIAVFGAPVR
jgi:hypothetical protein